MSGRALGIPAVATMDKNSRQGWRCKPREPREPREPRVAVWAKEPRWSTSDRKCVRSSGTHLRFAYTVTVRQCAHCNPSLRTLVAPHKHGSRLPCGGQAPPRVLGPHACAREPMGRCGLAPKPGDYHAAGCRRHLGSRTEWLSCSSRYIYIAHFFARLPGVSPLPPFTFPHLSSAIFLFATRSLC